MDGDQVTAVATGAKPAPLRRNRDFTLLWSGQATSLLGTQVSTIAYPLLILAVTGSAAQAGLVASASLVGMLAFLLPAGVAADRYPRKRVMVIASLIQMIVGATVVPAILTHHVYVLHLAAVGAIQGVAAAYYQGASRGATRRIVPAEQLNEAMAATQVRDRGALMLGPPLGGGLFSLARFLPFAADSFSFGAIAVAAALMRKPLDPAARPDREPLRRSVTKGVKFVLQQPFLRMCAIWTAILNGVALGVRLTIIVLARNRGATPAEIGTLFTISASCGLAGALLAVRLTKLAGGRLLVLTCSWLFPACAIGMFFAPSVWIIAVLGGVTGFALMPVNVLLTAYSARITPDHLQAQVGNALLLCYSSLSSFSPAIFGALTDKIGAYPVIITAAGIYGAIALWLQFNRQLYQLDQKAGAGPGAAARGRHRARHALRKKG